MRCRWKVIVRGEGQGWEHLNLTETQARTNIDYEYSELIGNEN